MNDNIKNKIRELVPDADEKLGLCVVLRAIANEPADFRMWVDATTFDIPHILMTRRDWKEDEPIFAWDLTKDYDHQGEECKQFIGSLILP